MSAAITATEQKSASASVRFEVDQQNHFVIRLVGPGAATREVRAAVKRLLDEDEMFYTLSPAWPVGGEYVANISLDDYWHRGFTRERAGGYAATLEAHLAAKVASASQSQK